MAVGGRGTAWRSKNVAVRQAVYPRAGGRADEKGNDEAEQRERVHHLKQGGEEKVPPARNDPALVVFDCLGARILAPCASAPIAPRSSEPRSRGAFCAASVILHPVRRANETSRALIRFTDMEDRAQPLILVVEDDELLRLHAADLLEAHGFAVVKAENADEALKVLEQRNDVRLLFTDIQMPGALDGMDLARQVHARRPNVLLIITSGQTAPTRAEIPDDGRFVAKPYGASDLLGQVDNLIHKA